MFFYFIFFIIVILLSINYPLKFKLNTSNNKKLILNYNPFPLSFLFISLVLGLRYNVGTDYMSYVKFFERYELGINTPDLEFGYELINRLTIYLGLNSWFVFLISALIINFLILKTFEEYSSSFLLSMIILFGIEFIFFQTNGMRQAIAIAFTFYGSKYIVSRNSNKYIFFVFLGMMFHLTAFIMIPMYWIVNIKWNKIFLLLILVVSFVLFLQSDILFFILEKSLNMFEFSEYNYAIKKAITGTGVNTGYRFMLEAGLAFLVVLLIPKKIYKNIKGKIYFNFFVLTHISNMFVGRFYAVRRINLYFSIFQTLFFPYLIYKIPVNKKSKMLITILIIIYFSFWTVRGIVGDFHDILLYHFVFNK